MKFKKETIKDGECCPFCGKVKSVEIADLPKIVDQIIILEMHCSSCKEDWKQFYKLYEVEEL